VYGPLFALARYLGGGVRVAVAGHCAVGRSTPWPFWSPRGGTRARTHSFSRP